MSDRSHAVWVSNGRRETEAMILQADGVSAMVNSDGSIAIELYTDRKRLLIRINKDDAGSQSHVFKRWGKQ